MNINHVLRHRGLGVDQDLPGFLPVLAHEEFMEEKVHQLRVAGIANGFVVQIFHPSLERFAHRSQSARSGKGLELDAVDHDGLQPLQGRDPFDFSIFDHFAVIQVFVHHSLGRPVEGIAQKAGGILGKRPHPQLDAAHAVEFFRQRRPHDGDEPRGQAALGGQNPFGRIAHPDDPFGGAYIFGQVEIVDAHVMGCGGNAEVEIIRKAGYDGIKSF